MKKKNLMSSLLGYAGSYKYLLFLSCLLSMASQFIVVIPYLDCFKIIREILSVSADQAIIVYNAKRILVFSLVGTSMYFIALLLSHISAFRIERMIREDTMKKVYEMPLGFFDGNNSGVIRKQIDENAALTHSFVAHNIPDIAGAIIFPLIMAMTLFTNDYRMGLLYIMTLVFSLIFISKMMTGKNANSVKNFMDAQERMQDTAVEYVRGIPVVKVFQQTVYSFRNFHEAVKVYAKFSLDYSFSVRNWLMLASISINSIVFIIVPFALGLINRGESLSITLLNVIFYTLFAPFCTMTIMRLLTSFQSIVKASEVLKRLENLMDFKHVDYGIIDKAKEYSIELENVSFSYPNSDYLAIKNCNLMINSGQRIALVGPSGGGKSTLAALCARFYDVKTGCIRIGGYDIRQWSNEALMDCITLVFQHQKLVHGTLEENLKMGKRDASFSEMMEACKAAQCDNVIAKLPDGLKTMIGSKGVYLSGGEQQRLLLARALLKNSPIVLLDEATAFADPENEVLIQLALQQLLKDKTVIMIAHRLSSIVDDDAIVVLDEGNIVEVGSHQELIALDGQYGKMWKEYQKASTWRLDNKEVLV